MQNNYSATMPNGVDQRDVTAAVLAAVPTPSVWRVFFTPADNKIWLAHDTATLSAGQVTAFQNAAAAATNDPNAPWRNTDVVQAKVAGALVRLRQIKTQAVAFQAVADYGTANLANLNDLLHKTQLIAGGIGDVADDLLAIARLMSGQYDGVS